MKRLARIFGVFLALLETTVPLGRSDGLSLVVK